MISFTLKAPSIVGANDKLNFYYYYFSEKIRFDISHVLSNLIFSEK